MNYAQPALNRHIGPGKCVLKACSAYKVNTSHGCVFITMAFQPQCLLHTVHCQRCIMSLCRCLLIALLKQVNGSPHVFFNTVLNLL